MHLLFIRVPLPSAILTNRNIRIGIELETLKPLMSRAPFSSTHVSMPQVKYVRSKNDVSALTVS